MRKRTTTGCIVITYYKYYMLVGVYSLETTVHNIV